MKILVPCCGRSSRYPDQPPKWTLPTHDGQPMVALAVSGLDAAGAEVVIAVLREHEERFQATRGIQQAFDGAVQVVIHEEPTKSQAETVALTLEALGLDEPFLVKDSDNFFELAPIEQENNYVCVDSLNNFDMINPRNKSYLQVDHTGLITNIREKVVISDLFSVGGYYFGDAAQFLSYYERLSGRATFSQRELYISDVIGAMLLDGAPFYARDVANYQDWGTVHEWRAALMSKRAFFVLLDGFAFQRGSLHFRPTFQEVRPNELAAQTIREAANKGHSIVYISVRPETLSELTQQQLAEADLPPGQVIYGCPTASWAMVTAPHSALPFETGHAMELDPDDPNLREKLLGQG